MAKGMNTSGPNGGRAVPSAAKVTGTKARTQGFQAPSSRGDTGKVSSRMDVNSNPRVPKQASVNYGPMTQMSAGTQRLGRTATPPPPARPSQTGQPRATQSTMTGKGSKQG